MKKIFIIYIMARRMRTRRSRTLKGGKRKRKRRRTKRRRSRKSRRKSRRRRGGSLLNTAAVPGLLYLAQKHMQGKRKYRR